MMVARLEPAPCEDNKQYDVSIVVPARNEADVIDSVGQNQGSFETEMAAHEFTTALRYSFWRIPLFEDRD